MGALLIVTVGGYRRTGGSVIVDLSFWAGAQPFLWAVHSDARFSTLRGVKHAGASLWQEPAAKDPPPVGRRDWLLGAAIVVVVVGEVLFRGDLVWRPTAAVFGLGLAVAVVLRRSQPLAAATFGFGGFALLDVATAVAGSDPVVLASGTVVLLLAYALFRWGSGRDAILGLAVVLASTAVIIAANFSGAEDAVGGPVVVLLAAAVGGAVRYRESAQAALVSRAKLHEREQLARELHDTVAHHVSAIAIQAQAGLFMARSSSLDGATDALEIIESEAARTLDEMRTMVSALRDRDTRPDLAPIRGIGDIKQLAVASAGEASVSVELAGDLADLPPAHQAALYRVAQESVTNALRHAHRATRIEVHIVGTMENVTLTVKDDGVPTTSKVNLSGFGLIGMTERISMLDGTLAAGPANDRGWLVHAVLPRARAAS